MKINLLNKLLKKTKNNKVKNLTSIFPKDNSQAFSNLKNHPYIISLIEDNVYAYRMLFCAENKYARKIICSINEKYESDITSEDASNIIISLKNEAIALNIYNDFEGKVVRLITNSEDLINKIWLLKITPPPPWISFPEIDPDGLGSMQGNLSFWWDWMWLPFWNSLDATQKNDYLIVNEAPTNWVEYFDFYETHINKET